MTKTKSYYIQTDDPNIEGRDYLVEFEGNSQIFSDSLSEASIQAFAELVKDKKAELPPILVSKRGGVYIIVDGHRRYLVARYLGWDYLVGIDIGPLTDDEIEDRILDCYAGVREASLKEKAALYEAQKRKIQREMGRTAGRPSKENSDQSVQVFSPDEINALAAKKAGIGSATTAKRLVQIFREYDSEIQEQVNRGELAISLAKKAQAQIDHPLADNETDQVTALEDLPHANDTKVEPEEDESTQVEEVSTEPKEASEDDPEEETQEEPTSEIAEDEVASHSEPDINAVASKLLKGLTAERCAELILMAIRGSDFADDTNAIMEPICRGLGMGWGDDDEPAEEGGDPQPTEEGGGEGEEHGIISSGTISSPLKKLAPPKIPLALRGISTLINHIDTTADPFDIVQTIMFEYDYVEEAGKNNAAKYLASIERLKDPIVADEIVRGLAIHYGLAVSSEVVVTEDKPKVEEPQ